MAATISFTMADLDTVFEKHLTAFELKVRKLQKQEFDCCSKCASDTTASRAEYEACQQRCSAPTRRAGEAFSQEVNLFQVRIYP